MQAGIMTGVSKRFAKRAAALLVAAALAISPLLSGCANQAPIEADESPLASTADVYAEGTESTSVSASDTLTIIAGAAVPTSTGSTTYTFPKLRVESNTTRLIKSITIQFTTAVTSTDAITLGTAKGFTLWSGNKAVNRSVNADGAGATAEQWEKYLRENLSVTLAGTGTKGLRMIASFEAVNRTLDYNSFNGHYYEVGPTRGLTWDAALKEAEKHTYLGMKGYLVTITSAEEQALVYSLVNTDTWIGGTCDDTYTRSTNDWAKNYRVSAADHPKRWSTVQTFNTGAYSHYYWVSGPEAGLKMGECKDNTGRRNATNPETGETMFMFWSAVQPDGYKTGEKWMQMFGTAHDSSGTGAWNDLPISYPAYNLSYVIEYGGMPDDADAAGNGNADADVDVDVDVDVYVKVDINIDPAGQTLSTEATNTTVGTKPTIYESVNGDTDITTTVDGVEQPAEITRTFYEKQADGTWRQMPDTELDDGYPTHAGTYKVVSAAPYSVDGGTATPYTPGESVFTIKPKTIDPMKDFVDAEAGKTIAELGGAGSIPGVDDDDETGDGAEPGTDDGTGEGSDGEGEGTDPDGSGDGEGDGDGADPAPTAPKAPKLGIFNKVFDGTDSFDFTRLTFPGLDGADVRLVVEGATYDSNAAGERTLTLTGVRLEGANAGDYVIPGLKDGVLTVNAYIAPRELIVTARSTVTFGAAHAPLLDGAGKLAELVSDEDVHDVVELPWELNMMAPEDAKRVDAVIESILGEAAYTCVREGDGLALDPESPEAGLYTVAVHFGNVNPMGGAAPAPAPEGEGDEGADEGSEPETTPAAFAASAARGLGLVTTAWADEHATPLQVVALDEHHFDLGNYLLELRDGKVLVSEEPNGETRLDEVGDVVVDEGIEEPYDPTGAPIGPEGVKDLIDEKWGDKVPEGAEPIITITKDGEPVDAIDPTVPGTYTVVAIYPDPEGGPDKIVRFTYTVDEPPAPPADENGHGNGNGSAPDSGFTGTEGPSGVGPTSNGGPSTPEPTWPDDDGYMIDEEVNVPYDPTGKIMDKPAIAKDLEDRYGDRDGFPKGVEPVIRITRDGEEVEFIDPKVPGTYVVQAEYTLDDGSKRYVRTSYTVAPQTSQGDNTPQGGTSPQANGGTVNNGNSGYYGDGDGKNTVVGSGGTSGGVASVLKLAQTGDTLALGAIAGVVVLAVIVLVVAAIRLRKQKDE